MFLLSSADFFQNQLFQNILSGTLSECQAVWIQIRTDTLSVLIWVQIVCKSYQQMTSCLNLVMLNLHFNRLLNPSATTINQVCCFVKITQSFLLNPFCIRFVTIYLSVCNFAFMYSYKEIKFKPTNMTKTFHRAAMFFFCPFVSRRCNDFR